MEYEKEAALFVEPRTAWKIMAGAHVVLMLIVFGSRVWPIAFAPPVWFGIGVGLIGAVWMWQLSRRKHVILVSRDCIRIVGRHATPEVYRIADVADVKWSFVSGEVRIERADGTEIATIEKRFLGSNFRMLKAVRLIRQYVAEQIEVAKSGVPESEKGQDEFLGRTPPKGIASSS